MKPLFKNITIYNSKNYNQFVKFHGDKFSLSYNFCTIIVTILLIYCIIINTIYKNILLALLFLIALILFYMFRMYIPMKKYQKTKKHYAKTKENKFTFSFYKFYFTVEKTPFLYLKLYKVFETKDYFYLYIDAENAILVAKDGFKIGSANEFSEFIKKKCLFKYSREKEQ